jgi:beta-N-acetylhexosaminidase
MIGHLHVPALDNKAGIAASMSPKVVKGLLRDEMSYSGLIFTDAMDMKAITKYYGTNGIAEAEAFLAGNDVILLPEDLPQAFNTIKRYVESGKITIERLDESIIRILRAKHKLGLSVNLVVNKDGAQDFINRNEAYAIKQKLYEAAITLVADQDAQIPIINTSDGSFGTLSINVHTTSPFQSRISDYVPAVHYQWMPNYNPVMANQMLTTMSQFSTAIVAIHTSGKRGDFSRDLSTEMVKFLTDLSMKTKVITVVFGHPYILNKIDNLKHVICAYENDDIAQDAAAQALFGANAISGRLPLKATEEWSSTHGIQRASLQRLGFSLPEQVGMNSALLQGELDRIAKEMIAVNATPGAQIFVARQGKIVYNRSHGRMQGDGADVRNHTIYDAASISKILATTLATMKLVDENKLDINAPLRTYISNIDTTNKADLVIADIMAHNARLPGGIPSYQPTVLPKSQSFNANYYRSTLQDNFYVPVANSMFMRNDYIDSLWKTIWQVPLRSSDSYRYSDVGFILMQKAIENITNKRLNEYMHQQFYKPLGLRYTSFLPLEKYPKEQIAPSEMDDYWRMQKIHGHVHDMTAAMMGGVGGHAGLFTTAYEAGIIMQMLINKGSYGGIQYIKPETVSRFTIRHHKSTRRGLGFDMRELDNGRNQNMSSLSSSDAFGHIGFTGGAAFADPRDQLVFVILTNRTYPEGRSQTYNNREYRIQLHTAIYNAIHRQ